MAVSNEDTGRNLSQQGEILSYRRAINYPQIGEIRVPDAPVAETQSSGFFGWGTDHRVLAHNARLVQLYQMGVEFSYAEAVAVSAEAKGIRQVTEGVGKMEHIVYALAPTSIAGMVGADMTSEATARSRVRHGRLMDGLDAEMLNTLHRR